VGAARASCALLLPMAAAAPTVGRATRRLSHKACRDSPGLYTCVLIQNGTMHLTSLKPRDKGQGGLTPRSSHHALAASALPACTTDTALWPLAYRHHKRSHAPTTQAA
jgi:hypothetical protein